MKKIFAIFFAVLVIPSFHAHAWVGGPFSNNNLTPGGDDGVYEAVATCANGTGLYRWGVGNEATATQYNDGRNGNTGNVQFGAFFGTTNQHVWYFEGNVYYGTCFGTVNSSAGAVRCVGNAADLVPTASTTGGLAGPGATVLTPNVTTQIVNQGVDTNDDGDFDVFIPTVVTIPNNGVACNSQFDASMATRTGNDDFGRHNPASKSFSGTGQVHVGTTTTGSLINDASSGAGTLREFLVFGNRVSTARNG